MKRTSIDPDEVVSEKDAIAVGLELLKAKWEGESEFDRGMRLLQEKIREIRGSHEKRAN